MAMKALEHLRGISADDVRRLRARGILHTNQLLHAATLGIDRDRLSVRTGISPDRLLELGNQCALLEISAMDRFVPLLRRLGVTNLKELKKQDPVPLHTQLVEALGLAHAPRLSDVQYWVSQARLIDMIEDEAPAAPKIQRSRLQ